MFGGEIAPDDAINQRFRSPARLSALLLPDHPSNDESSANPSITIGQRMRILQGKQEL
jgi:hypothetical protein